MKNEYKITKELMVSWGKEIYLNGAFNIIMFFMWGFIALGGLYSVINRIIFGGDFLDWYISIFLLAIGIFKLFIQRYLIWANRYKVMSKTYGVSEWLRTTEFTDEDIILTDHTSVTKLRYANIKRIIEKDKIVMIFFNNNLAIRLHKDAFMDCTWEECREKIRLMRH